MTSVEIISLIVTFIGVASFATVFTILYHSYSVSTMNEIHLGKRDIELIDEIIYEKQENVKKRRKVSKLIKTILFYVVLIIIIPIFIFSLINKIQGNTTMIGNQTIMVVASGSMSEKNEANDYLVTNQLNNQFQTYDIITLQKVKNADELKVYDVIAFKNDQGMNVIHRIISMQYENGVLTFTTRGDANNASDKYHPTFEDVIGKYSDKRIKALGIFIVFFQSYPGIITIVSLVYCLIMIDRINSKVAKVQEERVSHLSQIIEQIKEDNINDLKAVYKETIYYKGFAYHFDDKGFIEKTEIQDENVLKRTDHTIIKVTENKDSSQVINEINMDEKSKGEQ